MRSLDRSHLGYRHLELGQQLQQECLELFVRAVHLVDQEDGCLVGLRQRRQEGALQQELLAEYLSLLLLGGAAALLVQLDPQELLGVVPLVKGGGNVQPLVALEADELGVQEPGHHGGDLSLADAGATFDQEGTFQGLCKVDRRGNGGVGDVALRRESIEDVFDRVG